MSQAQIPQRFERLNSLNKILAPIKAFFSDPYYRLLAAIIDNKILTKEDIALKTNRTVRTVYRDYEDAKEYLKGGK